MYNVLIVDDERFVRASVTNRTDWAALGLQIVGQAGDGAEALDLLNEVRVDIAIVDVRMPRMDGLELIRRARERDGRMQFIILSGYNDFDYARKAIRQQVVDYLLKPVDPAELRLALMRCIEALDNRIQSDEGKESDREREQRELMEGLKQPRLSSINLPRTIRNRPSALILADAPSGMKEDGLQALKRDLNARFSAPARVVVALSESAPQSLRILLIGEGVTREDAMGLVEYVMKRLDGAAFVTWAFAQAAPRALYEDCVYAREFCLLSGMGARVMEAACAPRSPTGDESEWMARWSHLFSEVVHEQDSILAKQALSELFGHSWSCPKAFRWILQSLTMTVQQYALRHNAALPTGIEEMADDRFLLRFASYEQLKLTMTDVLLRFLFSGEEERRPEVIEQIELYIEKHLADDLRIEVLAKEFFLSVSYLSQLFKSKTGMPISSYIEARRMERAKRLLIQQKMSIMEIATHVGYGDSAYFARAFKRCTQMTPKKYRQIYAISGRKT